jgi:3-oxoacyl-[acyl-carrier protein] reductase
MKDHRETSRAVVVTGGSSGVGAAFCRAAACSGWHVWIGFGSGTDRATAVQHEILRDGGSAVPIHLPLADPDRLRDATARMAVDPMPEALVLCAAAPPDVVPFTKITADQLRRQLETAVVGNHALIAEMWRRCFRPLGGGHVLAVLTSALGPPAAAHMATYIAAKGSLQALLQAAAAELGPAGLRVSMVHPGYIETPMLSAFEPRFLERARLAAAQGRFLAPDTVASALLEGLHDPPGPGSVRQLPLVKELEQ